MGIGQQEIADHLGVSYQAYAHYERGRRSPSPDILVKLANYFNVTVDYLLIDQSNQDRVLIERDTLYSQLTPVQKDCVSAYIEGLLKSD